MFIKLSIISIFVIFYAGVLFFQSCENSSPISDSNTVSNTVSNAVQTEAQTECPKPTEPFPSYSADKTINQDYSPPEWYCREYNDAAKRKDFPIYQLSQNYAEIPAFSEVCAVEECPWLNIDYKKEPRKYLEKVLEYAYKGNLETDWTNPKGWYSAPYMHLDTVSTFDTVDPVGREFMRGLTQERAACSGALDYKHGDATCAPICDCISNSDDCYESWAVSFYNGRGASYIKKVWDEVLKSKPNQQISETPNLDVLKAGFPDGAVAVKFLFTEAKPDDFRNNTFKTRDIDYLNGSIEWQTDIRRAKKGGKTSEDCLKDGLPAEKCFPKLRLMQVDVAIKDKRMENGKFKSPTGWVFGTFIFNNTKKEIFEYKFQGLTPDEENKKRAWLKLEWVGLMFGNDPTKDKIGDMMEESKNNSNISEQQHFGCGAKTRSAAFNRLSGPIDSPQSSCLSCHAVSETPVNLNPRSVPYAFPQSVTNKKGMGCDTTDDETYKKDIDYWFRNINPHSAIVEEQTFAKETYTLDYSLQLREGIFRFWLENQKCFESKESLQKCVKEDVKNDVSKSGIRPVSNSATNQNNAR